MRSQNKKKEHFLLKAILLTLFSAAIGFSSPIEKSKQPENQELNEILVKTGEYCERVKQMALLYVCNEHISDKENFFDRSAGASGLMREEKYFKIRKVNKNNYIYDYQLIKNADQLEEKRILMEENGKKRNSRNAQLSRLKYIGKYLVFGPVGFLSQYWQDHFNYEVLGFETLNDRKTTILAAVPKNARKDNNNMGRIWIDESFQILRLEWEPVSIKGYKDEVITSGAREFKKKVTWTVDYEVTKNGVRFPSRQRIIETYTYTNSRGNEYKAVKREIRFDYKNYQFFTVETDIKYK